MLCEATGAHMSYFWSPRRVPPCDDLKLARLWFIGRRPTVYFRDHLFTRLAFFIRGAYKKKDFTHAHTRAFSFNERHCRNSSRREGKDLSVHLSRATSPEQTRLITRSYRPLQNIKFLPLHGIHLNFYFHSLPSTILFKSFKHIFTWIKSGTVKSPNRKYILDSVLMQ